MVIKTAVKTKVKSQKASGSTSVADKQNLRDDVVHILDQMQAHPVLAARIKPHGCISILLNAKVNGNRPRKQLVDMPKLELPGVTEPTILTMSLNAHSKLNSFELDIEAIRLIR